MCQMENILKVINSWWDIAKEKIIVLEYTARNNPKGKPEKNMANNNVNRISVSEPKHASKQLNKYVMWRRTEKNPQR